MKTVAELLLIKGSTIWSLSPDDTIYDAVKLMADKSIGAVAIISDEQLVGIVTERDYARKVILKELSSKTTKIKEIMTTKIYHAALNQTVDECLVLMKEKKIRHLPVMDEDKLVGLIAIRDVITEIICEHEYTINQLEHYIDYGEMY